MNWACVLWALLPWYGENVPTTVEIRDLGKAPAFSLPDLDGRRRQLSEFLDKGPVVIHFWATWCGPCLREMKALKALHKTYADRGVEVISISIDDQRTVSQVRGTVKSRRFPFVVLLDTDRAVLRRYQGQNPPFSMLLDAKGTMVFKHEGFKDGDEKVLEAHIRKLLESGP